MTPLVQASSIKAADLMELTQNGEDRPARDYGSITPKKEWQALLITFLLVGVSVVLMFAPLPAGLSPAGQRVLAACKAIEIN